MVKVNSTFPVGVGVGERGVLSHAGLWTLGRFVHRPGSRLQGNAEFGESRFREDVNVRSFDQ